MRFKRTYSYHTKVTVFLSSKPDFKSKATTTKKETRSAIIQHLQRYVQTILGHPMLKENINRPKGRDFY